MHEMVDGRETTTRARRLIRAQYEAIAGDPSIEVKYRLQALDKLAKLAIVRAYEGDASSAQDDAQDDTPQAIAKAIEEKLATLRLLKPPQ